MLRGQDEQLAVLSVENQRLSNLVVHARMSPANDNAAELAKLRAQAEALRNQTNDSGRRVEAENQSRQPSAEPVAESHPPEYWEQLHRMSGAKPLDARNLASALQMFALDHQGQFPSKVDQIASYLSKEGMALSGTNQFDIVYQGSLDQLDGIPVGTIAVVRDRDSWTGPDGKKMRVYGMSGGVGQVVSSDDDFHSWEAKHILAPQNSANSPAK
jgi:hypothetical protein